jgi:hypothetical protein
MNEFVFVTLTDNNYFERAKQTIVDLRTRGNWSGDIVVISVNFSLPFDFKKEYNLIQAQFEQIDKANMLNLIQTPFTDWDGREFNKLNQWEKLHVFDDFFTAWKKVIFFDAGLRILDSVDYLLNLECNNVFLAPNDAGSQNRPDKIFSTQISFRDTQLVDKLTLEFGEQIYNSQYFLNCIWMYDTQILNIVKKQEFIDYMNKYPFCKTNEMTIMNLLLHFKYSLWKPFPNFIPGEKKYLFDWCETNNPGTNWTDYCYLKYPITIAFD